MDAAEIRAAVESRLPEVVRLRHELHRIPEIAAKEFETARLVRRALAPTSLALAEPLLGTDVVGLLAGREPGPNVTLRADMDALPLQEQSDLPYRSRHDGFMHACGHDGHTAMLIGAALVLDGLKDRLRGSVRFVFQPGEEVLAVGRDLVAAGCLRNPEPAAVIALHAKDELPAGVISSRGGPFLAAADMFRLTVRGKGAHGSRPEQSIDPILTAARIIEALQAIPARMTSALDPVVVSVCTVHGGAACNVIPDSVELGGTTRYFNREVGDRIPCLMEQVIAGVCASTGASYLFKYDRDYIPTVNSQDVVGHGKRIVEEALGPDAWRDCAAPSLGGEDFAYYIRDYPGAMFWLGMGENSPPLHNPAFDFNDAAIGNGVRFLVAFALSQLA